MKNILNKKKSKYKDRKCNKLKIRINLTSKIKKV